MVQEAETPTLTEAAPEMTPAPGPLVAQPQVEEGAAAEVPAEEIAEQPAENPAWASLPEAEVLEHDAFKTILEERYSEHFKRGEMKGKADLLPLLEKGNKNTQDVANAINGLLGRWVRAQQDGTLDANAIDSLLTTHAQAFRALDDMIDGTTRSDGISQGYNEFLTALGLEMGDASLASDFMARIRLRSRGAEDDSI